jgi:hypothetical protein
MKRCLLLAMFALCTLPLAVRSEDERPATVRGVRPLGLGNSFTAVADDQNVFFYNPAGTVQRTGSMLTILGISGTMSQDTMDAYDFVKDNKDKLTNFDKLTRQEQIDLINEIDNTVSKLEPHVQVSLPNINYLSGPMGRWYWGAGVFGQVSGKFGLNADIVPTLDYDLNTDAILLFNLARKFNSLWLIPGKMGLGANLKYIRRNLMKEERVSFLQLEDIDSPQVQKGSGKGIDVGMLYQPTDRWNVGLTAMDLMGTKISYDAADRENGFSAKPARDSTIKTRWNVGLAWTPARLGIGRFGISTGDRLMLTGEVRDFANPDTPVFFSDGVAPDTTWTHVHMGAEYRWSMFRFRGGFNQGYGTFGFGLELAMLKLEYTHYSDELGLFAGSLKDNNHMVEISLRFGGNKTEARDRIANKSSAAAPPAPAAPPPPPAAPAAAPAAPAEAAPAAAPAP